RNPRAISIADTRTSQRSGCALTVDGRSGSSCGTGGSCHRKSHRPRAPCAGARMHRLLPELRRAPAPRPALVQRHLPGRLGATSIADCAMRVALLAGDLVLAGMLALLAGPAGALTSEADLQLLEAATRGDSVKASALIARGANANATDDAGQAVLCLA